MEKTQKMKLRNDGDNSASESSASVARLGAAFIFYAAEIVFSCVNDKSPSEDRFRSAQRDDSVDQIDERNSFGVSDDVAQIAGVTLVGVVVRRTVKGLAGVVVRAGRVASVGEDVAKLVDVEAVITGSQSRHPADDPDSASGR